jgi:hypothetical protein
MKTNLSQISFSSQQQLQPSQPSGQLHVPADYNNPSSNAGESHALL